MGSFALCGFQLKRKVLREGVAITNNFRFATRKFLSPVKAAFIRAIFGGLFFFDLHVRVHLDHLDRHTLWQSQLFLEDSSGCFFPFKLFLRHAHIWVPPPTFAIFCYFWRVVFLHENYFCISSTSEQTPKNSFADTFCCSDSTNLCDSLFFLEKGSKLVLASQSRLLSVGSQGLAVVCRTQRST